MSWRWCKRSAVLLLCVLCGCTGAERKPDAGGTSAKTTCLSKGVTLGRTPLRGGRVELLAKELRGCRVIQGDVVLTGRGVWMRDGLVLLGRVQRIEGSLIIRDTRELLSLSGLEELRSIGGSLKVERNAELLTLRGLGLLESIERDVLILNNNRLTALKGVESLRRVGGSMVVAKNTSLGDTRGPDKLERVGRSLVFEENSVMVELGGLSELRQVGRTLRVAQQRRLRRIKAFSKLERVGWAMELERLPAMRRVRLPRIERLGGVVLRRLPLLRTLEMPELERLDGRLELRGIGRLGLARWMADLEQLTGSVLAQGYIGFPLGCLVKRWGKEEVLLGIADIKRARIRPTIRSEAEAKAFGALECGELKGGLSIEYAQMKKVPELGIHTLGGNLVIQANPQLTSLRGLSTLRTVKGSVEVAGNARLPTLDGLEGLRTLQGSVLIHDNARLRSVALLRHLRGTLHHLVLARLPVLEQAPKRWGLSRIDGSLVVRELPKLKALGDFAALTEVRGDLTVLDLPVLTTLQLPKLARVRCHLLIGNAPALQRAQVPMLRGVWGEVRVWDAAQMRYGWTALRTVREGVLIGGTKRSRAWLKREH